MPSQSFKLSSILMSTLLLTFAPLNFATPLSQSSSIAILQTLPADLPDPSNSSITSTYDLDFGLPDPTVITNHTQCRSPVQFEANPREDCYFVIQYYLQQYPFYKNNTLTKRRIPGQKYMTVPKIYAYRTCHLTIDMVKANPTMNAVGASVTQWLWDLYSECFPEDDPSRSGGGATAVDYFWEGNGKEMHNEFKIQLRTRNNPHPRPSLSSSSASASATATATAGALAMDSSEIEIS